MESKEFNCMSVDELWDLHETINSILFKKIEAEKAKLLERLRKLESVSTVGVKGGRPYPPVRPKYKNPKNPAEVWSGRGKQPRWVRDQLKTGRRLDQFLIAAWRYCSSATNEDGSFPKILEPIRSQLNAVCCPYRIHPCVFLVAAISLIHWKRRAGGLPTGRRDRHDAPVVSVASRRRSHRIERQCRLMARS